MSKERTVVIHVMGGLGNQMFQIMTAMAYADRIGARLLIPAVVHGGRPDYWRTWFQALEPSLVRDGLTIREMSGFPMYREPAFHYVPIPVTHDFIALNGYFQSPRYFEDTFLDLVQHMGWKQLREESKRLHDTDKFIKDTFIAGIHIRRGDYARYPQHHPILPVGYYKNCLNRIIKTNSDSSFESDKNIVLVFSDEKEVDLDELVQAFPQLVFKQVHGKTEVEEMLWMSWCPRLIIANSSFSWWAAYLGYRLSGIEVYYPGTWFGPALQENLTKDMFPEEWNCIDV